MAASVLNTIFQLAREENLVVNKKDIRVSWNYGSNTCPLEI